VVIEEKNRMVLLMIVSLLYQNKSIRQIQKNFLVRGFNIWSVCSRNVLTSSLRIVVVILDVVLVSDVSFVLTSSIDDDDVDGKSAVEKDDIVQVNFFKEAFTFGTNKSNPHPNTIDKVQVLVFE
jgi:hypothetical protein